MKKYNPNESILFQIENVRNKTPKFLSAEYFIFMSTLYGRRFESGDIRIAEFNKMTMYDVQDEIQLRLNMLRADNKRKIEQYKDKKKKEQDRAIQELLMVN